VESLIKHVVSIAYTAATSAIAALGLGILHIDLPFTTRYWGSLAILTALALNAVKGDD
jgi:hypothetical protein